ncbi:GreA/GreB family elongation factor [Exiguobacterium sp. AT1b]|uniref:GreA/GreB family elongation factor n=1 Tax=Exiguobacterium sp. (strain ATCC BAA-1283 / AT1b) TaxID=360911 RepID=UPI000AA008BE|nr:GreA/GreB family elongation factor [Exiguobacterium sp. AT1b]
MEADIRDLKRLLADVTIVKSEQSEVVTFGNRVVIREGDEETESYRIVSEAEADL